VRLLRDPDHRRAGFEYYRAVFSDAGRESARWRSARPIDVPLLFVGARHGVGDLLLETFRPVATRREAVLLDCGHYVPEERPVELAAALRRFWG
jgi:pimeloyl-ACP methyl ester carboxylesterase